MFRLELGSRKHTEVYVADEAEFNAHHEYIIKATEGSTFPPVKISFQKGPTKEHGVNGIFHEDLLNIVKHRLQCFQQSKFKCDENAKAIGAINEALTYLRARLNDRVSRGVDGINEV